MFGIEEEIGLTGERPEFSFYSKGFTCDLGGMANKYISRNGRNLESRWMDYGTI